MNAYLQKLWVEKNPIHILNEISQIHSLGIAQSDSLKLLKLLRQLSPFYANIDLSDYLNSPDERKNLLHFFLVIISCMKYEVELKEDRKIQRLVYYYLTLLIDAFHVYLTKATQKGEDIFSLHENEYLCMILEKLENEEIHKTINPPLVSAQRLYTHLSHRLKRNEELTMQILTSLNTFDVHDRLPSSTWSIRKGLNVQHEDIGYVFAMLRFGGQHHESIRYDVMVRQCFSKQQRISRHAAASLYMFVHESRNSIIESLSSTMISSTEFSLILEDNMASVYMIKLCGILCVRNEVIGDEYSQIHESTCFGLINTMEKAIGSPINKDKLSSIFAVYREFLNCGNKSNNDQRRLLSIMAKNILSLFPPLSSEKIAFSSQSLSVAQFHACCRMLAEVLKKIDQVKANDNINFDSNILPSTRVVFCMLDNLVRISPAKNKFLIFQIALCYVSILPLNHNDDAHIIYPAILNIDVEVNFRLQVIYSILERENLYHQGTFFNLSLSITWEWFSRTPDPAYTNCFFEIWKVGLGFDDTTKLQVISSMKNVLEYHMGTEVIDTKESILSIQKLVINMYGKIAAELLNYDSKSIIHKKSKQILLHIMRMIQFEDWSTRRVAAQALVALANSLTLGNCIRQLIIEFLAKLQLNEEDIISRDAPIGILDILQQLNTI